MPSISTPRNESVTRVLCCSGSLAGGGSERQLWQFVCGLYGTQFAPEVYLLYRQGHYLQRLPREIPVHAFEDLPCRHKFYFPGRIHRNQVQHVADLIRQQQIDVVYDRTFHMTLITAAATRATRTPRISVIVNQPSLDFAANRERFSWIKRRHLATAYRDPRSITVAVSSAVAQDAAAFYGLPLERIHVLPNPVDSDSVLAAANAGRPPWADEERAFRIAIVGRLVSQKGQLIALEALADLFEELQSNPQSANSQQGKAWGSPLPVIELLGEGPLQPELERFVARRGIQPYVRFRGFLENPYPAMAEADVVCIPSLYEGLANVALEAMAVQTPVIAAACNSSMVELVGADQRGALFQPGDAAELKRLWMASMRDGEIMRRRATAAEEYIRQYHSLTRWMSEMKQLLQQAMSLTGDKHANPSRGNACQGEQR